jgi:hypothetical protein
MNNLALNRVHEYNNVIFKNQGKTMSNLSAKKKNILKLLQDKNIQVDKFAHEYLEKATDDSLELLLSYIESGEYTFSLYVEGYVKDILVGNIHSLKEMSRK